MRTETHLSTTAKLSSAPPSPNHSEVRRLLDTAAAAQYLGLGKSTLIMKRLKGGGPVHVRQGRRVAYLVDDLNAWIDANRVRSTSEAA